jgi:uncharacterized protein DUF748
VIEKIRAGTRRAWTRTLGRFAFSRTRWFRRSCTTILIILVVFSLIGFVGVPVATQYLVVGRISAAIHRPVTIKHVRFNPYNLRLDLRRLHVGGRDPSHRLIDVRHVLVKLSWKSLFRMAPIVREFAIYRPDLLLERSAEQRFNISDLLEKGPTPAPTPAKPQRFAVSNIQVHDGQILFQDDLLRQQHSIKHLELRVPFIANLPADVDVSVQPLLQMLVDGSRVRIAGRAKPFAAPPESEVDINLHQFGLPLYVGYVPVKLPVKIPQGALSSHLRLQFVAATSGPEVRISGDLDVDQLDVRDLSDAPVASFNRLAVGLDDLQPFRDIMHFGQISLDGLNVNVIRKPDGTTNLASLATSRRSAQPAQISAAKHTPVPQAAPPTAAAPPGSMIAAQSSATPSANATLTPAATPTQTPAAQPTTTHTPAPAATASPADISLKSLVLTNGTIRVTDSSVAPPAGLVLGGLKAGLENLRTVGQAAPATFNLATTLGGGGSIGVKGALDLARSQVTTDLALDAIDLAALQQFAHSFLAASISSGKLNAHANLRTLYAAGHFNVHAAPARIAIDNFELRVPQENQSPLGWNKFSVSIGRVDLAAHQAAIDNVSTEGLHAFVRRERNGQLNLASLLRATASAQATPAVVVSVPRGISPETGREKPPVKERLALKKRGRSAVITSAPAGPSSAPSSQWHYQVGSVALEKNAIRIEDDSLHQALEAELAPLDIHLKNLSNDFSKPISLDIDGKLNRKGSFKIAGTAAAAPLAVNLRIKTDRLDIAQFDPYLTGRLNTKITRALLSMNGALDAATRRNKMNFGYRGDAALYGVRMLDEITGDSFMRWSALNVNGINARIGAGEPHVHVAAVDLRDFYARIILNSDGRLNISDVTTSPEEARKSLTRAHGAPGSVGTPAPTSAATPAPAGSAAAILVTPTPAATPGSSAATPAQGAGEGSPTPSAVPSPAASATPIPADLEVGRVGLKNGQVDYNDYFIRPNYAASLSSLMGDIGTFGTKTSVPAAVRLQALVNGNAPLQINGSINPLTPLAYVDLKANAKGVELTNVSTYSVKYTGYPITSGKLTVDVHYLLENQKLTAQNHILIDQLTFGDKVESKSAMNLPIRLAVAILKNPQGEIDLRLPVSGSLSDPEFSLGGIIWHALAGLIVKAATSPFNLIASAIGAGGGGENLNYVAFKPGWASLTPTAQKKLDTVAKALQARPSLHLEIIGRVDPKLDLEKLPEALLEQAVATQKVLASDQNPADVDLATVKITPDEYNAFLKRAYKAAKFEKPRDLLGLVKSLPPDEMKKLMLENTHVSEKDLKQLAEGRANAVRKYLSAKVNPSRLHVAAPKLTTEGISGGDTTRADLSLQ